MKENPRSGTALGHNLYKIRVTILSKGKGKSGGARVISLVEPTLIGQVDISEEEITVSLITIYDKADTSTISVKELKEFLKTYFHNK